MKESDIMRVSKIAAAVAISTGLLMGCNGPETVNEDPGSGNSGGGTTPDSPLAGVHWTIGSGDVAAQAGDVGLPNVYVFSGTSQKYYNDDNNPGVYTITPAPFSENDDTMTFTYYGDSVDGVVITNATFSVTDGTLTIDRGNDGMLSGQDQSDAEGVKDAVLAANAESGANQSAQILDTLTDDTGELRITLSDSSNVASIGSGKLSADLILQYKDGAATGEGSDKAYVSLFASGTSTTQLFGEFILESKAIKYRGAGDADTKGDILETDGTYEHGTTLSIEAQWDKETEIFTFTVNGEEFSGAVTDPNDVTVIAFKLGDNSATTDYELIVDNIVVTNIDENGDETAVLEDDFENYTIPHNLGNTYSSSSSEATVISTGGDSGEPELGYFPVPVNEYKFDGAEQNSYFADSGSAGDDLSDSKTSDSIAMTSVEGANGNANTALHIDQDSDPEYDGYVYYTYKGADNGVHNISASSFSVEAVIKRDREAMYQGSDSSIVEFYDKTNNEPVGFKLAITEAASTINFRLYGKKDGENEDVKVTTANPIVDGEWYHLLSVYDQSANTMAIYVNGQQSSIVDVDLVPIANADIDDKVTFLGSTTSNDDKNFDGAVDNIALWNVALTPAQIAERATQFGLNDSQ
jgi:hypothetical protein